MSENSIPEQIARFSYFEGIDCKKMSKDINIKTFKYYLTNLQMMKNYYLLDFSNSDSTGFFDIPGLKEMFKIIDQSTKKAFAIFDAMFVQNLSSNIQKLMNNPKVFAQLVKNYFEHDLINKFLFGYTSFPAIYGYFSLEEFTKAASEFLKAFFSISTDVELCSILLKSFLKGSTLFFDHFLCSIGQNMNKYDDYIDLKDAQFFHITNDSIKQSIPNMSNFHIAAVESYVKAFPKHAILFFVENVLYAPFARAASACSYFHNQKRAHAYKQYLENLKKQIYNDDVLELLNSFVYFQVPKAEMVSFGKLNWSGAIPLMLSDVDVKLIHEICTFSKSDLIYWPKNIPNLKVSFSPMLVDIFPNYPIVEFESFGGVMIGKPPVVKDLEKCDEYNRMYAALIKKANDEKLPISTVIKRMKFRPDIEEYLLNLLLQSHCRSYTLLQDSISKEQYFRRFANYCEATNTLLLQAIHQKSLVVFKNILFQNKPVAECIIDAICYKAGLRHNISQSMYWELILSVMDSYRLKVSKRGYQVVTRFKKVLFNYVGSHFKPDENKLLAELIARNVVALSECHWTFGKMLRQIIEFERQLRIILGTEWEDKWTKSFAYALMSRHPQMIIFPVFLFCHMFIFSNDMIGTQIPEKVLDGWHNFCAGMWAIICTDDEYLQLTTNVVEIKKLFTYPE